MTANDVQTLQEIISILVSYDSNKSISGYELIISNSKVAITVYFFDTEILSYVYWLDYEYSYANRYNSVADMLLQCSREMLEVGVNDKLKQYMISDKY